MNLGGNLQPKLEFVHDLMSEYELDVLMLQDVGLLFDDIDDMILSALQPYDAFCHCSPTNKARSVMIVVRDGDAASAVSRDGTGSAIAVTLRLKSGAVRLISVYSPPGLDNVPASSFESSPVAREACALADLLASWTSQYDFFVVGGDMNQTWDGRVDRSFSTPARTRFGELHEQNPIRDLCTRRHWIDCFRAVQPVGDGFTHQAVRSNGISRSRIDYLFVPDHCRSRIADCWVGDLTGFPSDHAPLFVILDGVQTAASTKRRPFVRSVPNCSRLYEDPALRAALTASVQAAIYACMGELTDLLDRATRDADASALDLAAALLSTTVRDAAAATLGTTRAPRTRRRSARCVLLRQQIRRLRALQDTARLLLNGALSADSARVRTAVRNAVRVRVFSFREFAERACDWQAWLEHSRSVLSALRRQHRVLLEIEGADSAEQVRRLFHHPHGRGKFYSTLFRRDRRMSVDSAVDPASGRRVFEPKEYMPMVRATVSAPFSRKLTAPTGRDDRLHTPPPRPDCALRTAPSEFDSPRVKPTWWDAMYARNAKGVADDVFAHVLDPVSTAELAESLRLSERHKAPGHDAVSIDIFKCAYDSALLPRADSSDTSQPTLLLHFLCRTVNAGFKLGVITDWFKHGLISMIPKPGASAADVAQMRPITLLSEFGKVGNRILASRIGKILEQHPGLLNAAQRAFLTNGCIQQNINAALDILEDHWESVRAGSRRRLYVIAYDQRKAYDSVQEFTIRASLERFNFPETLIRYVCSGLAGAKSAVITRDGITDSFDVLSSVRQGDPLAPLIYILVADALHDGLAANPISGGARDGYLFSNGKVRVASSGYADDTMIFSDSWEGIWRLHMWVCDFFMVHGFAINSDKTKFLVSDARDGDTRVLFSPDGARIMPKGPGYVIRYLGLHFSLNLDLSQQIAKAKRSVELVCRVIRAYQLDLLMAVASVNEFLVPKLDLTLQFAPIDQDVLRSWSRLLMNTICAVSRLRMYRSLSLEAFCAVTGMVYLPHQLRIVTAAELVVRMNSRFAPCGDTLRCRLQALLPPLTPTDHWSLLQALADLPPRELARNTSSRLARDLHRMLEWGLRFEPEEPWYTLPVAVDPALIKSPRYDCIHGCPLASALRSPLWMISQPGNSETIYAFTDGSTPEDLHNSGFAAVFTRTQDFSSFAVRSGGFRCSGNNFLAEALAVLTAILLMPQEARLIVHTDSMAVIGAVRRIRDCERARIRSAARPVITSIRRLLRARVGAVEFRYVRAHTGGTDFESVGNRIADRAANEAREQYKCHRYPHFRYNEERTVLFVDKMHVIGDAREEVKRISERRLFDAWCLRSRQGEIAASHPAEVRALIRHVRRRRDASALQFALLALTQWLPTRSRLSYADPSLNVSCPLCVCDRREDLRHFVRCPATAPPQDLHERVRAILRPPEGGWRAWSHRGPPTSSDALVRRQLAPCHGAPPTALTELTRQARQNVGAWCLDLAQLPNPDIWLFAQCCLDDRYERLFASALWPDTLAANSISAVRVWLGANSVASNVLSGANTAVVLPPAAARADADECLQIVADALLSRQPTRVAIVAPMRLPLLVSHSSSAEWSPRLPFLMLVSNNASCSHDPLTIRHAAFRRAVIPTSDEIAGGVTRALHWFDPLQPPRVSAGEQLHGERLSPDLKDAFLQIDTFDRSAGALGILPESLRLVLRWRDRDGTQCSLKLLDRMLVLLRAAIFDHALNRWVIWQRLTTRVARRRAA